MESVRGWYEKRTLLGLLFTACLLLTGLGISHINFGPAGGTGSTRISVVIEHFGTGSAEIEETITIPLEEALLPIAGIRRIRGISTLGRCRIDCILDKGKSYPEIYTAVRAAVEQVHATLPQSVQKPRILTGSASRRPAVILALPPGIKDFSKFEGMIEGIDGVGEVEIGGKAEREVHLLVDMEKASAYGLHPGELAGRLASELPPAPAGMIRTGGFRIPVRGAGPGKDPEVLGTLQVLLPSGSGIPLTALGTVAYGLREPDSISRVDGETRAVAYIQGDGTANTVSLSRRIRAALGAGDNGGLSQAEILFDAGAAAETSLFRICKALGVGMAAVAATLILFGGTFRQISALVFFLPLSVASSAAVLTAAGIGIDKQILAGFALGAGMVVDIDIIVSEHLQSVLPGKLRPLRGLLPPLVSSTLTTVAVLLPFTLTEELAPGARQIALSVTVTLVLNLLFSLLFLPPFLLHRRKERMFILHGGIFFSGGLKKKFLHGTDRLQKGLQKLGKYRLWAIAGTVTFCAAAVLRMGTDFTAPPPENLLYSHVEFESGASVRSVDRRLARLSARFGETPGIEQIETMAKQGSGTLTAHFDPAVIRRRDAAAALRDTASPVPGCFAYIPDPPNTGQRTIEITLYGPDHETLRRLARTAASRLQSSGDIHEAVLHFKKNVPVYVFEIDHDKASAAGVLPDMLSRLIRWNVHPPVSCKWLGKGGERDVRIIPWNGKGLHSITVPVEEGEKLPIRRFGRFYETREPGTLYRENRQGAVYCTVHIEGRNLGRITDTLWEVLRTVSLPEGYGFQIDRRIFELAEGIRRLTGVALLVTVLVYMILAVQFESFRLPFVVLSIVPLSAAFPLTALWIGGKCITLPVLIGCIVLVGSSVNNAILITDRFAAKRSEGDTTPGGGPFFAAVSALRKRLRSLLLASCTTIVGTLPLFFLSRGTSRFLSEIAFVIFFGTVGSVVVSCTLFPLILSRTGEKAPKERGRC
jgi:HAE1 family hydrophobic/amphiphilic exporter-1